MPEAGAGRPPPCFPSLGRHPQRLLLAAFLGCELAVLACLLWRAGEGWAAGQAAPLWWAALAIVATLAGGRAWQAGWHAAGCRYAGMASRGGGLEIAVALPDGGQLPARVVACWHLGGLAAVLRLAPAGAAAAIPPVLVVWRPGAHGELPEDGEARRRALLRALHAPSEAP